MIAGVYVWLWPALTPFDRWAHLGEVGSSAVLATGLLAVISTAMPSFTLTIWTAFLSLGVAITDLALAILAQWHPLAAAVGFVSVAVLFYNTLLTEWASILTQWRTDLHRPIGPVADWVATLIIRGSLLRRLKHLLNRIERLAKQHPWVLPCGALAPVLTTVPFGLDFVSRVAASLLRTRGESPLTIALFVTTSVVTLICIPAAVLWAAQTSSRSHRQTARP